MNPSQSHTAFSSLSSFTPRFLLRYSPTLHACAAPQQHQTTMVAPKHVRRSEEIKRLTKQLEQLRAARDQMKKEASSSPPSSTSSPAEPSAKEPTPPPVKSTTPKPSSFKLGKHSEGSRFLSISDFPYDEFFPRILPVPGIVPGLTVAQLEATPSLHYSKEPELGTVYVTNVPNEYKGDLIAVPLPENISEYVDPVVLRVDAAELSEAQLPCAHHDCVYAILDRGTADADFDDTKFYAWDVDGTVQVGWANRQPADGEPRCLGKIIFGILEIRKDLRKEKSCWEEENEGYG